MTRQTTHDATGPLFLGPEDVDPEKGDIAVCRCGLSEDFPFCDGTHRATEGEEEDAVYRYVETDEGLERKRVVRVEFADGTDRRFEE